MAFELIGAAGLPQAIKLAGALGAAGIDLVNKLKRTDNYQLGRLTDRTAAAYYAYLNSPTDWGYASAQLTELVQIYAMLGQADRYVLAACVADHSPMEVQYTAPTTTLTRRREYDALGRLRVEQDSVTVTGSEITVQYTSDARPASAGRRGTRRALTGGYGSDRRSPYGDDFSVTQGPQVQAAVSRGEH
jgi:hypothetical protein